MKTAYPNTTQPVTITLYNNIPFDNTYKNHSFISNKFTKEGTFPVYIGANTSQERFLNRKVDNHYVYKRSTLSDVFNFDFKNGLIGSVTLELSNAQTNANYMKVVCGSQTWYYFITAINQSNIDTYTLSLELDVIMTYGDDFLEGMQNVPVFTKRKHCRRYYQNFLHSRDYKNGESSFANIKPNIVKEKYPFQIDLRDNSATTYISQFEDVLWVYITTEIVDDLKSTPAIEGRYMYGSNGCLNPFSVVCFPLNKTLRLIVNNVGVYEIGGIECFRKLVNQGSYKSAKILPFPPFHRIPSDIAVSSGEHGYAIDFSCSLVNTANEEIYLKSDLTEGRLFFNSVANGGSYAFSFGNNLVKNGDDILNSLLAHTFVIRSQEHMEYAYLPLTPIDVSKPNISILTSRFYDPKLLFSPFTKYVMSSTGSDELEFYVELLVSLTPYTYATDYKINLKTVTTAYAGDYSIFSYITPPRTISNYAFKDYKWAKVGLSSTPNYVYPVGENALDVFKSTQSETFYQSKIASGVTSGLTIGGGIAMTGVGIGMVASGGASPFGVGMIATGIGAIASGTASMVDTIKSTNAKVEDLKNTPDSINISGSNYAHDYTMNTNGLLPYILVYECSPVVKNSANDWFYRYGYEVARDCYFNSYIPNEQPTNADDTSLFGRTIFNYIQINEDITTKIRSDIPMIAKQKLSNIFNQGITLWTFLGFASLYGDSETSETTQYNIDKWLYKNNYDNTEYKGETYL